MASSVLLVRCGFETKDRVELARHQSSAVVLLEAIKLGCPNNPPTCLWPARPSLINLRLNVSRGCQDWLHTPGLSRSRFTRPFPGGSLYGVVIRVAENSFVENWQETKVPRRISYVVHIFPDQIDMLSAHILRGFSKINLMPYYMSMPCPVHFIKVRKDWFK